MKFSFFAKAAFVSATLVGLAVIGCSSSSGTPGKSCAGAESICNNECIDTQTDPNNCGACAIACKPGEVCNAGACALSCGTGSTQCGASCFDTKVDPKNCGACGTVCNAGQVCVGGSCSAQCPAQQTLCLADGGAVSCVTTTTDATNCGGCGSTCDVGKVCSGGKCGDTCGVGEQFCKTDGGAPYCAAVQNDNSNCGACGTVCGNGQVCSNGKCQGNCGLNETLCSGQDGGAAYCAKTGSDQANCGQCGKVCNGQNGEICSKGTCQLQCGLGLTACGKECVDLKSNRDHCNSCNTVCPSGLVCSNGACTNALPCSVEATKFCTSKGWTVVTWSTAYPNPPGGAIYCTSDGRSAANDCDTCGTYNEVVWKNVAKDACNSGEVLTPGTVYAGHSPCTCGPNLLTCGNWPMNGCTPN